MTVLGFISAPSGAGAYYAEHGDGYGFRGRAPRWHASHAAATVACRAIERAGRRDGGRGRDCYIVAVAREDDGRITVTAGATRETGLHLSGAVALPLGCHWHVADATRWLQSRPPRWLRQRGIILPSNTPGVSDA